MRTAAKGWRGLVTDAETGRHIVQVYRDEAFLVESVSLFAAEGLARGEGALVVATEAHRGAFERALSERGVDLAAARAAGRLVLLDARRVVDQSLAASGGDPLAFARVATRALDRLAGAPSVRVYLETEDLLWRSGRREAALRLEERWNELARARPLTLLCAYELDWLDAVTRDGGFRAICGAHSHVIPARDGDRLDEAVDVAVADSLGPALTRMVGSLSSQSHATPAELAPAQQRLLWLLENMPATSAKVLARARRRYETTN